MEKLSPKFITLINDCKSQNDIGRLETRYATFFPGVHIAFVGIDSNLGSNSTLEAAGNLVDTLDASGGAEGVIAVNVAPRGQVKEDGENGSRFCYFWYKKTLIVSTIKGYNLSLIKKLGITKTVNILETKEVLNFVLTKKIINKDLFSHISNSQFRSFDFQPRVAKWLANGQKLPHHKTSIDLIPDPPYSIWLVDSFGNAKTTLLIDGFFRSRPELVSGHNKILNQVQNDHVTINTNYGQFHYHERLRLVPDGETAVYTGSSGIEGKRFLEIATQNRSGSAAKTLNLKVGDKIELK